MGTLKPKPGFAIDQELFVRYAQASALFPMMQFSLAPWRVLDEGHLASVREAALLHTSQAEAILALAKEASETGIPIVRNMEFAFPNQGYEAVRDQFLLGDDILVAPISTKGRDSRTVLIPPGRWEGMDGAVGEGIVRGPETRQVDCGLALHSPCFWCHFVLSCLLTFPSIPHASNTTIKTNRGRRHVWLSLQAALVSPPFVSCTIVCSATVPWV